MTFEIYPRVPYYNSTTHEMMLIHLIIQVNYQYILNENNQYVNFSVNPLLGLTLNYLIRFQSMVIVIVKVEVVVMIMVMIIIIIVQ